MTPAEVFRLKAPAPKESQIQGAIKAFLTLHGWFVVKIHQSLGSVRGIADLYALKNGVGVWIEVKTAKGRLSEHQVKFQAAVERHGGAYAVLRSLDDAKRFNELFGRRRVDHE